MKTNIEIAAEYESKFRFYFVALVFTLLAASVQSASLSEMIFCNKIMEIIGWFLLLVCGLSSLSLLELSSVIYRNRAIAESPNEGEVSRTLSKEVANEINEKSSVKYRIAKWSFSVGFISIISSRVMHGFATP